MHIRSLNANGESLVLYLSLFNCEFDVELTETWMGELSYFVVGASCRSPNLNLDLFMNCVEGRLSSLGSGGGDVIVYGDFYLGLLSLNENSST